MQDLRLVAANERGSHLVLRSVDGEKYVVSIDERLRAAVRGDRSRLALNEGELTIDLRPRDIQARIRAGATAEQIARAAGIPLDRVRRYEGPVLAEREHIVTLAQRSMVRRPGIDTRPMTLGETLLDRRVVLGLDPEALGWDAWRREDGRWVIQIAYRHGEASVVAHYLYDLAARSVVADNDEARWLTGELVARPTQAAFVPRLAPAPSAAIEGTPDATPAAEAPPMAEAVERSADSTPITPRRAEPPLNRRPMEMGARPGAPTGPPPPVTRAVPVQTELPHPAQASPAARSTGTDGESVPRGQRSRRASVPAWDDIMFGARRQD